MNQETRAYYERRAREEGSSADRATEREAATAHRELENLYRARLLEGTNRLGIVTEA